jgi:hypothetical protein
LQRYSTACDLNSELAESIVATRKELPASETGMSSCGDELDEMTMFNEGAVHDELSCVDEDEAVGCSNDAEGEASLSSQRL